MVRVSALSADGCGAPPGTQASSWQPFACAGLVGCCMMLGLVTAGTSPFPSTGLWASAPAVSRVAVRPVPSAAVLTPGRPATLRAGPYDAVVAAVAKGPDPTVPSLLMPESTPHAWPMVSGLAAIGTVVVALWSSFWGPKGVHRRGPCAALCSSCCVSCRRGKSAGVPAPAVLRWAGELWGRAWFPETMGWALCAPSHLKWTEFFSAEHSVQPPSSSVGPQPQSVGSRVQRRNSNKICPLCFSARLSGLAWGHFPRRPVV